MSRFSFISRLAVEYNAVMLAPVLLAALVMIESPAAPGSAEPHLTSLRDNGHEGGVAMSWLEPTRDRKHALKLATYRSGKWSAPRVIAERDDFFVNWADFPSIVEDRRGTLFAQWLQKSGAGTYAYDVWITRSGDLDRRHGRRLFDSLSARLYGRPHERATENRRHHLRPRRRLPARRADGVHGVVCVDRSRDEENSRREVRVAGFH